jgi:hypothetical protein
MTSTPRLATVVQPLDESPEVADSVVGRVLEGLDVQLVENGVLVPQRVGAQRGAPCVWLSVSAWSAPWGGTSSRALACVAGPARRLRARLQELRRGWGQVTPLGLAESLAGCRGQLLLTAGSSCGYGLEATLTHTFNRLQAMSDEFSLEEYRTLRTEVLAKVDAVEKLSLFAAGAVAAVYSWLATQEVRSSSVLWYLPVLFPALGAFRARMIGSQIKVLGEYLRLLEEELGGSRSRAIGWEKYRQCHLSRFMDIAMRVFWILLLASTLLFPRWYAHNSHSSSNPSGSSTTQHDTSKILLTISSKKP